MKVTPQLSQQAIDKFKAIYQKEFGESLSDDEAREIAVPFLSLFKVLIRPNTIDS